MVLVLLHWPRLAAKGLLGNLRGAAGASGGSANRHDANQHAQTDGLSATNIACFIVASIAVSACSLVKELVAKTQGRRRVERGFYEAVVRVLDGAEEDTPEGFEFLGFIEDEPVYLCRFVLASSAFFRQKKRSSHTWHWSIDARTWMPTSTKVAQGPNGPVRVPQTVAAMITRLETVRLLHSQRTVHHPPAMQLPEAAVDPDADVPGAFVCPVTQAVFTNPVVAPSGVTYEKEQLERWLHQRGLEPTTCLPLHPHELYPNLALRSAIEAWAATVAEKKAEAAETAAATPTSASASQRSSIDRESLD